MPRTHLKIFVAHSKKQLCLVREQPINKLHIANQLNHHGAGIGDAAANEIVEHAIGQDDAHIRRGPSP